MKINNNSQSSDLFQRTTVKQSEETIALSASWLEDTVRSLCRNEKTDKQLFYAVNLHSTLSDLILQVPTYADVEQIVIDCLFYGNIRVSQISANLKRVFSILETSTDLTCSDSDGSLQRLKWHLWTFSAKLLNGKQFMSAICGQYPLSTEVDEQLVLFHPVWVENAVELDSILHSEEGPWFW